MALAKKRVSQSLAEMVAEGIEFRSRGNKQKSKLNPSVDHTH